MSQLTPENIDEYAVCVDHTVQVLTVDEDGYLNVSPYEVKGRGGSDGREDRICAGRRRSVSGGRQKSAAVRL